MVPTPVRLLRSCARREARGALLADNANTLREFVDLVKKKVKREKREGRGQELSPFFENGRLPLTSIRTLSVNRETTLVTALNN